MKIVFEKFYKRTVDGVEEHFATSPAFQPGKALRLAPGVFAIVDLPADLGSLAEVTRGEWIAADEPISIEIHGAGDPPAIPPKRELTPEEVIIDQEYRAKVNGAHALRMERIRMALADSTHDLIAVETSVTTTTTYNSVPLAAALGHLLAPDPDPVDPIVWRRAAGQIDKVSLVNDILSMLGPLVSSFLGTKVSASVKPAAAPVDAPAKPGAKP